MYAVSASVGFRVRNVVYFITNERAEIPKINIVKCAVSSHKHPDKELLEEVQRKFTRMIKELKGKNCHERPRHLNLSSLEEKSYRRDLVEIYKMYKAFPKLHRACRCCL